MSVHFTSLIEALAGRVDQPDARYLTAARFPLNSIADQVEMIDRTGRNNVKMVIDYSHCLVAGGIPDEAVRRDLPTGESVLDFETWTDAAKSTNYVGWWNPELFCRRQHQHNSYRWLRKFILC